MAVNINGVDRSAKKVKIIPVVIILFNKFELKFLFMNLFSSFSINMKYLDY